MRQVLHIFRKDCRQVWPEILASLLVTALFVWVYPYQWLSPDDPRFENATRLLDLHHLQILANFITGLLPLSWFLLVARVVHAENLIGTRQFWVTRPYIWQKLLAEKVFFLAAFLYIPFAAAQLALLARAGFSPLHYFPGLLFNLLLLTGICVLPFFSFAAVVSSLLRMFLVLLAICAIIGIIAFFASSVDPDSSSLQIPYSDRVSLPLALAFCAGALVAQYSGRRLWLARALLITGMITIALEASNPLEGMMFEHYYPPFAWSVSTFHAAMAPQDLHPVHISDSEKNKVELELTVWVPALGPNQAVSIDDSTVTLVAADGEHITTPWKPVYNQLALRGAPDLTVSAKLDRAAFERFRSRPFKASISLAVTELRADPPHDLLLKPAGEFPVQDVGLCTFAPAQDFSSASLNCKVAWHQPFLTNVSAPVSAHPCQNSPSQQQSSERFSTWIGALAQDPADFGLTPVWQTTAPFSGTGMYSPFRQDGTPNHPDFICPGTTIAFTRYRAIRRFRYNLAPQAISLPNTSQRDEGILSQP
jgi:hypothetical protein